jgi:hypothetical protein
MAAFAPAAARSWALGPGGRRADSDEEAARPLMGSRGPSRPASTASLRSAAGGSSDGSPPPPRRRRAAAAAAAARLWPTRREAVLLLALAACLAQMLLAARARSRDSLAAWVHEAVDAGRPAWRRPGLLGGLTPAPLPPPAELPASRDACAAALGSRKVALMILTQGEPHHEGAWRLWFEGARGLLPAAAARAATCAGGAARVAGAALPPACAPPADSALPTGNAIAGQHLFSVYVHAPPAFSGFRQDSLWAGSLIERRVEARWGDHSLVEATRALLWEAFKDPSNGAFLLLSESDLPLYDPATLWAQLLSERRSRLDTRKHARASPWRWDPRMESPALRFEHWRKSPQWLTLTRAHAKLVLDDVAVYRAFEAHCWSAWDDANARWHRDCFSDEHYFATLLAAAGRGAEGVPGSRGAAFAAWDAGSAHPREFAAREVGPALWAEARRAPADAAGAPAAACDGAAAQAAAAAQVVAADELAAPGGAARACAAPPPSAFGPAALPPTCFVVARKFPRAAAAAARDLFADSCANGLGLVSERVCAAAGGRRCAGAWARLARAAGLGAAC